MRSAIGYCRSFCLFILLMSAISCNKKVTLDKIVKLNTYSAGSALVKIGDKLYLVGDDMGYVLVLDQSLNILDSIVLIDSAHNPIPKPTKPDLEAATVVQYNGADALLAIGSGSLDPYRNRAWLVNVTNKQPVEIDLSPFYTRLKALGLRDLNIEGCTTAKDMIVLSARGNKTDPVNHLIFTSARFWERQATAPISISTVSNGIVAGSSFSGVSGLEYSTQSDCLLLTLSTEETKNSYDDGTIGKSYIWLIRDISKKTKSGDIRPDRIYDLQEADSRFKGQKIETACIISETPQEMHLALSADNDDDKTVLFLITLQK